MARNYCSRATDGADPDVDRSADVSQRRLLVYAPQPVTYQAIVAYEGTSFFGWQKTTSGPSVQQAIETALHQLMQTAVTCEAASRTDRGVHARGQVIAFQAPRLWDPDRLIHALNSTLPSSIRILEARIAPPDFHPSLNALGKEYHYDFYTGPALPPFLRRFCWHYPYPIDPQQIRQAAAFLEGTHDFSSFTTERPEDPVRTVNQIELLAVATDHWRVAIRGDRFLYKMARTLAGTLANVGSGKLPLAAIPELLLRPCRAAAGVTAPAHGLTLHQVCYTIHQK